MSSLPSFREEEAREEKAGALESSSSFASIPPFLASVTSAVPVTNHEDQVPRIYAVATSIFTRMELVDATTKSSGKEDDAASILSSITPIIASSSVIAVDSTASPSYLARKMTSVREAMEDVIRSTTAAILAESPSMDEFHPQTTATADGKEKRKDALTESSRRSASSRYQDNS